MKVSKDNIYLECYEIQHTIKCYVDLIFREKNGIMEYAKGINDTRV